MADTAKIWQDTVPKPCRLYLLSGFLGSGKTSLLMHVLSESATEKIGVIQNEFGRCSIDGDIVRSGDIEMIEINRGSIFCSCLKLHFVSALVEMSRRGLDKLFVESSGLADPSNLEEILAAVQVATLTQPYVLAAVICLVDAVDFERDVAELETVERQIRHCNLAVINKCDQVSEAQVLELRRRIRALNANCLLTETCYGRLDLKLLEQDLTDFAWAEAEASTNTVDSKPKTFSISFEASVPWPSLEAFLRRVLPECYRIKGFALVEGAWEQIDGVGERLDRQACPVRERSRLVFISRTGIALIRTIDSAWKAEVALPVKLEN